MRALIIFCFGKRPDSLALFEQQRTKRSSEPTEPVERSWHEREDTCIIFVLRLFAEHRTRMQLEQCQADQKNA